MCHDGIAAKSAGGEGLRKSRTLAFRCWREAAILGEERAMYAVGLMYLEGRKVEQSDRKVQS